MEISKLLVSNTEVITKKNESVSRNTTTNKKRHACTWLDCRKSFSRPSDMSRHYRIHTNDRPYQCSLSLCGKRFIQRSALTVHERTHSGEKPHICQYPSCNKSFGDSSSLARHRRIHTQARSFVCDSIDCTKSYTKKSHLTRHIRRCHAIQEQDNTDYNKQINGFYRPIACNADGTPHSEIDYSPYTTASRRSSPSTSYFNALLSYHSPRRSTTTTDDEDEVPDYTSSTTSVPKRDYWSTPHYLCYDTHPTTNTSQLYQSTHHNRADYL